MHGARGRIRVFVGSALDMWFLRMNCVSGGFRSCILHHICKVWTLRHRRLPAIGFAGGCVYSCCVLHSLPFIIPFVFARPVHSVCGICFHVMSYHIDVYVAGVKLGAFVLQIKFSNAGGRLTLVEMEWDLGGLTCFGNRLG